MSFYRGRRAWVVGASQGIGEATSHLLSDNGARVTLFARRLEPLQQLSERLSTSNSIYTVDVSHREHTEKTVRIAVTEEGIPDFVFLFPGFARAESILESGLYFHQEMMQTNYFGTLYFTKAVLPYLLKRGRGHLIHTSSLAGIVGLSHYSGYCASKFAVAGFSEALRRELLGTGVQVTLLLPPNVRTPGLAAENLSKPEVVRRMEESIEVLDPSAVAGHLLRKLPHHPSIVIPCPSGWAVYYLSRLAPWLIDWWGKRA